MLCFALEIWLVELAWGLCQQNQLVVLIPERVISVRLIRPLSTEWLDYPDFGVKTQPYHRTVNQLQNFCQRMLIANFTSFSRVLEGRTQIAEPRCCGEEQTSRNIFEERYLREQCWYKREIEIIKLISMGVGTVLFYEGRINMCMFIWIN